MTSSMEEASHMKSSSLAKELCQVFSVFFAIIIRIVLAVYCVLTVMVVVNERGDDRFWALTSILILMLVEGVYTVVKRRGRERKWVCYCFVCYFLACIPSIWLLELQKIGKFKSTLADTNTTLLSNLPGGLSTSFELESDDIIFILENFLVFLPILCRWILPRGDITRDQLSQLLFVFIGMASDVMELFQLFEEDKIKQDRYMPYVILTVWTISLFQFTLVLTMSASPEKSRVAKSTTAADHNSEGPTNNADFLRRRKKTFREFLVQSEIWSLVISITMQDGPYLGVRLYAVIKLRIINSTIVFFVLKNIIVVMLLAYRLTVVGLLMAEADGKSHRKPSDGKGVTPSFKSRRSRSYNVSKTIPAPPDKDKSVSEAPEPDPSPPSPNPSVSGEMRVSSVHSDSESDSPEPPTESDYKASEPPEETNSPKPTKSDKRILSSPKVEPFDQSNKSDGAPNTSVA
ncbi:hypothetical protein EGW08_019893 [Elysia chlorotica]|uniref:Transmembrane protein 26 n=1 Tax=Elysia chlorotica TaxID=188477 RepID=A0A433SST2_ELYCH|nr:hypothetical protein EGW08_019893 [Elysia chlorotica]